MIRALVTNAFLVLSLAAQSSDAEAVVARFLGASGRSPAAVEKAGLKVVELGASAVPHLLEGLGGGDARRALLALRALKAIRSPHAAPAVLELCRTAKRADVRAEAISTASCLPGADLTPILQEATRADELPVRRRAWDAVRSLSPKKMALFLPAAVAGLIDEDFWVRGRCQRVVSAAPPHVGRKPDPLIRAVHRVLPKLDHEAAVSLFRLLVRVRPRDVPAIVKVALDRGSVPARIAAFGAAADLKDADHVRRARSLCRDRETDLAQAAMAYLGRLRDKDSVPMLVDLLDTIRDARTREVAAVTLRKITGRTFGYDVDRWRQWLSEGA